MTPLERAARALAIEQSGVDEWDALDEAFQERLKEQAAAVLQAIREPSEGMVDAMADTPGMIAASASMVMQQVRGYPFDPSSFADGSPLEQAWRAGIDAALTE